MALSGRGSEDARAPVKSVLAFPAHWRSINTVKYNMVKVLVLLFSIAGGSCLVWNASQRGQRKDPAPSEATSAAGDKKTRVTDAEVKAAQEDMMRSSKSGHIMSEEATRKMLEERQERRKDNEPKPEDLAPSSKVMRIVGPDRLKEVQQQLQPSPQPEPQDGSNENPR